VTPDSSQPSPSHAPTIAVIGLGYAGLTLALKLAEVGFKVTGVEAIQSRVDLLSSGQSYVHENGLLDLLREQLGKNLSVTTQIPADADVFIIAVGTPVKTLANHATPAPDLSYLTQAAAATGARLKPGAVVVIRSTVPVGACRSAVLPELERASGLKGGTDFHLAFAPERTVEGKALIELRTLPQIIGGLNPASVESTAAVFRVLSPSIVPMESIEAAELAKLLNNSFRDYVFAFANQVAQLSSPFNIDVVRCIQNANQGYPRDPIPLPSPGVGGPCLTKDPWIFAAMSHLNPHGTLSAHARLANDSMIDFVADSLVAELTRLGKSPTQCTVIACGMAFKGRPETGDLRNSTSVDIVRRLSAQGIQVLCHDPVATPAELIEFDLTPAPPLAEWRRFDALLLLNNHPFYAKLDLVSLATQMIAPGIVYDSWRLKNPDDVASIPNLVYMGLGFSKRAGNVD